MRRKSVDERNKEMDNITEWMVSFLLWLLILCVTCLIVLLVLFGV